VSVSRQDLVRTVLSARKLALKRFGRDVRFSHFGEQALIKELVAGVAPEQRICVDIGASDGVEGSNTLPLFQAGWGGLAAEFDPVRFAMLALVLSTAGDVDLVRGKVTPPTVGPLLRSHGIPREFGLLDIDIDSYDYYVLDAVLADYRPRLIVAEINETIPSTLRFTVNWNPDFEFRGDNFFGLSLTALTELAERRGYVLAQLHYNNAFLVAAEHHSGAGLNASDAYAQGYVAQPDRRERFYWNEQFEPLLTMTPEAARDWLDAHFADRRGEYELEIVS
jgi:hypothetical protein